jgi:hypothetical protein
MEEKKGNNLEKQTNDIVKSLENIFKQFPHLPQNVKEVLVNIAPWIALIFGILGVIGGVSALIGQAGLSAITMYVGARVGVMVFLTGAITIVSSVLMLMAYPKLVKRAYSGWTYLLWAQGVSAISAILSLYVVSVLGIIVGLWLLFELKSFYK